MESRENIFASQNNLENNQSNESAANASDGRFDFNKYRHEQADELRKIKDPEKRRFLRDRLKNEERYQLAQDAVVKRRQLELKTKGMGTPERLDVLTDIIGRDTPPDERGMVFEQTYDDLVWDMVEGGESKEVWNKKVAEYMTAVLEKRKKMIEGLNHYFHNKEDLPLEMREHQDEALEKIREFLEAGYTRGYVEHPTGAGKTILFASLLKLTEAKGLLVVPKKVLVGQTVEKLRYFMPDTDISFVGSIDANKDEKIKNGQARKGMDGQIVIAVEDSFKAKAAELAKQGFDMMVWDEAHNSYTKKGQDALRQFPDVPKMAFTATPSYYRTEKCKGCKEIEIDGSTLYYDPEKTADHYYTHEIDRISLQEAIERGMLLAPRVAAIDTGINLDDCAVSNGARGKDFTREKLQAEMNKHWGSLKGKALNLWEQGVQLGDGSIYDIKDKQIFAVCDSVAHARDMADDFEARGMKTACIHANTTDRERDEMLRAYEKKEIQMLTSVEVLKEGWDSAEAEICLMMRPTMSRLFYQQAIGRILRLNENNPGKDPMVIDFQAQHSKMKIMSLPRLFGKDRYYDGEIMVKVPDGTEGGSTRPDTTMPEEAVEVDSGITWRELPQPLELEKLGSGMVKKDDQIYLSRAALKRNFGLGSNYEKFAKRINEYDQVADARGAYFSLTEFARNWRKHLEEKTKYEMLPGGISSNADVLKGLTEYTGFAQGDIKQLVKEAFENTSEGNPYNLSKEGRGAAFSLLHGDARSINKKGFQALARLTNTVFEMRLRELVKTNNATADLERLFGETADSAISELSPDQYIKVSTIREAAARETHVGIKDLLESIHLDFYDSQTIGELETIRERWPQFKKIKKTCDRLISESEQQLSVEQENQDDKRWEQFSDLPKDQREIAVQINELADREDPGEIAEDLEGIDFDFYDPRVEADLQRLADKWGSIPEIDDQVDLLLGIIDGQKLEGVNV